MFGTSLALSLTFLPNAYFRREPPRHRPPDFLLILTNKFKPGGKNLKYFAMNLTDILELQIKDKKKVLAVTYTRYFGFADINKSVLGDNCLSLTF